MRQTRFMLAIGTAILTGLCSAMTVAAEDEEFRLRATLVDGSLIIGTTDSTTVTVDVGFAELNIPLERVRQLTRRDKEDTVQLELNNGDIYSGKPADTPLQLKTIFGPVRLTMKQIVVLDVMPAVATSWLPTQRGLVLYFPFDDGASATNHAGDRLHGHCTKVAWQERGRRDGAMIFNGAAEVTVAHHAALCPQQFTQAAWICPQEESTNYQVVWAKTNPGSWSPGYGLVRFSGDARHLHFFVNNYSGSHVKAAVPIDEWSHVAAVFDGTTLTMYLNGNPVDTRQLHGDNSVANAVVSHTETPLTIGGDGGHHYGWRGQLDDFVMFDRALDAREIRRLFEVAPRLDKRKPAETPGRIDAPRQIDPSPDSIGPSPAEDRSPPAEPPRPRE